MPFDLHTFNWATFDGSDKVLSDQISIYRQDLSHLSTLNWRLQRIFELQTAQRYLRVQSIFLHTMRLVSEVVDAKDSNRMLLDNFDPIYNQLMHLFQVFNREWLRYHRQPLYDLAALTEQLCFELNVPVAIAGSRFNTGLYRVAPVKQWSLMAPDRLRQHFAFRVSMQTQLFVVTQKLPRILELVVDLIEQRNFLLRVIDRDFERHHVDTIDPSFKQWVNSNFAVDWLDRLSHHQFVWVKHHRFWAGFDPRLIDNSNHC